MVEQNLNNSSLANEQKNESNTKVASAKTKKRAESPYLKIRSKAVNIFRNQIDKSIVIKRKSVERAIDQVIFGDYTKDRFLSEFKSNIDLILDSKKFNDDCVKHNLTPFNAATHIALEGSSKMNLVLKKGFYQTYHDRLKEFIDPIFTKEVLEDASTVAKAK